MPEMRPGKLRAWFGLVLGCCTLLAGCAHFDHLAPHGPGGPPPNESAKLPLPTYVIEPPDVLQINAVNLLPRPNHLIKPLDVIRVQFPYKTLSAEELKLLVTNELIIDANFTVEMDGNISLAPPYNLVINVYNLTAQQAEKEIADQLKKVAKAELVDKGGVKVRLVQAQGLQMIQGQHLVQPDGTVNLGIYGSVPVAGLTVEQTKQKIEQHLGQFLQEPAIAVAITGYNSKVYYVIYDGGGNGEQVVRLPVTGNETVLDAVGNVNGLPAVACKSLVWISRPSHDGGEGLILPVDWRAISQRAVAKSNYQMLPGDRLYVKADPLITLYTHIDRFIAPIERVMGGILLGTSTYRALKFANSADVGSSGGF
jgi:polysaccharide biosynthesis/export protein